MEGHCHRTRRRKKSTLNKVNTSEIRKGQVPGAESARRGSRQGASGNPRGFGSPRPPSSRHVERDREDPESRPRCGGPHLPSLGTDAHEVESVRRLHCRRRRGTRRQRLRLAHARPAKAELERDDRGVSSLDVHGAGPSRPRARSSHRARSDPIRRGARHPRDAPPRFDFWRAHLHASRFRTNNGDAIVPGTRKTSRSARSRLPENRATRAMTIRSVRARKPSNTTLIYEARTRRVFPMTTAYDVPPVLLIERIKEKLQAEGKIKPPEWAAFARTGVTTEKAPVQKDWWYRRVAAVLRKVYLHGPVGTSRPAAAFGGRRDDGSAPDHPRRGSRSAPREAMQHSSAI